MRYKIIKYSVFLILTAMIGSTAFSQGSGFQENLREMVQMEIEYTDQLIERARETVQNSESLKAKYAYNQAVQLQEAAKNLFDAENYRRANTLTKQAREKAKYALVNGPFNEQNDDYILRHLERTREMLNRIKEDFSGIDNPQMEAVYEQAQENMKKAWELYRAGQNRPAVKLSNQVENLLKKVMDTINRQRHGQQGFEQQSGNLKRTMEQAGEIVRNCDSDRSHQLLEQAKNTYQLANKNYQQQQYEEAIKALQNARKLSVMALQNCNWQENFQAKYEKIKTEADRVKAMIPQSDQDAWKLLNQVDEQLQLAREAIDNDNPEAAGASLRAANLTLEQVNY